MINPLKASTREEYYLSKNIPKDEPDIFPKPDPSNILDLLEITLRPQHQSKIHKSASNYNSRPTSNPNIGGTNSSVMRTGITFGGGDYAEQEMNEFYEDQFKVNSPKTDINKKNGFQRRPEEFSEEILEERENQRNFYIKNEQLRIEKENLAREIERIKNNYEKRIENLKGEITIINSQKIESQTKEHEILRKQGIYEQNILNLEDEKDELTRKIAVLEAKNHHKQQYQILDEEIWKKKYEDILGELTEKDTENKKLKNKNNELMDDIFRKEESKNNLIENYENKLKNLNHQINEFKMNSDKENLNKYKKELTIVMEELTECKNLIKIQAEQIFNFEQNKTKKTYLDSDLEELQNKLNLKNKEIISIKSEKQYNEKIFFLIFVEIDRLNEYNKSLELEKEDKIKEKLEIRKEIEELYKKLKNEREIFEAQIHGLTTQNDQLIEDLSINKNKHLNYEVEINKLENEIKTLEHNIRSKDEILSDKSSQNINLIRNLDEKTSEISSLNQQIHNLNGTLSLKNSEIIDLKKQISSSIDQYNTLSTQINIKNNEINSLSNQISQKNSEITLYKAPTSNFNHETLFVLMSIENDRLCSIIEEKENQNIFLNQQLQEQKKSIIYSESSKPIKIQQNNISNYYEEDIKILKAQKEILEERGIRLLKENEELRKELEAKENPIILVYFLFFY